MTTRWIARWGRERKLWTDENFRIDDGHCRLAATRFEHDQRESPTICSNLIQARRKMSLLYLSCSLQRIMDRSRNRMSCKHARHMSKVWLGQSSLVSFRTVRHLSCFCWVYGQDTGSFRLCCRCCLLPHRCNFGSEVLSITYRGVSLRETSPMADSLARPRSLKIPMLMATATTSSRILSSVESLE
jgi:hypothetical protein